MNIIIYVSVLCMYLESVVHKKEETERHMSSLYITECDGSGILELVVRKVKELVETGTQCRL